MEEDDGLWREQLLPDRLRQDLAQHKRWQEAFRQAHPTKVCTKCGETLPRTSEHYYRDAARGDGLRTICKHCESRAKPGITLPGMRRCGRCHQWKPATWAYFRHRARVEGGWDSYCVECRRSYNHDDYRKRKAIQNHSPLARLIGESAARHPV